MGPRNKVGPENEVGHKNKVGPENIVSYTKQLHIRVNAASLISSTSNRVTYFFRIRQRYSNIGKYWKHQSKHIWSSSLFLCFHQITPKWDLIGRWYIYMYMLGYIYIYICIYDCICKTYIETLIYILHVLPVGC